MHRLDFMRYTCAHLQVMHPIPQLSREIENGLAIPHIELPVGIAIFSHGDDRCWLNLINAPEAIRWLVIFASLPAEKEALINAIDLAQYPLSVRYEVCECLCDEISWLNSKRKKNNDDFHRISRFLNQEIYGQN